MMQLAALLALFLGAGRPMGALAEGSREMQAIRIEVGSLRGPTGVGLVKMLEDRPSLGPNVEASYTVVGSPDLLVSRVLSGELDFAALPTNVAAKLYNEGVRYPLAAMHVWGVLYVLERGQTVRDWTELRGADLGSIGKGATPDIVVRFLLERAGLDPERDLSIRYYLHAEMAQMLIAGLSDLAVLAEPFVTKVLLAAQDVRVAIDVQKSWARIFGAEAELAMGCLVVKEETARRHPELVSAFLSAYRESIEWVNEHPAEAGVLVEKHQIGFTAAEAAVAIPRSNIRYEGAQSSRRAVEAYLQVLLDYSAPSIGGRLPDDGFYLEE
jgi:NitT/TauT family transport system substrate-binding protein